MKLSILHISDLHRDPDNPIGNEALLDSLENDRRRYTIEETSKVRSPDLIIVSGDVIHGVRPDAPDADKRLRDQYAEALDFLNRLTWRLLDGDKRRVVVVPGNHDVSAYHFFKSLQRIDIAPDRKKELVGQLFSRNSTLRWSWSDFELYKIVNGDVYVQRLAAFSKFYKDFYAGARTYPLEPSSQFDIFDIPEFNLTSGRSQGGLLFNCRLTASGGNQRRNSLAGVGGVAAGRQIGQDVAPLLSTARHHRQDMGHEATAIRKTISPRGLGDGAGKVGCW